MKKFVILLSIALLVITVLPLNVQGKARVHRLSVGESLYQLALQYNTTLDNLLTKNKYLLHPNVLLPGQVLIIPEEKKEQVYQVQSGDTLTEIAQNFGLSLASLAHANNLINWDYLYKGQVLTIPPLQQNENDTFQPQDDNSFAYSISQLAQLFQDTFYLRGTSNSNKVALTFDDGPDDIYTPQVLEVLDTYNIPATFFLIGESSQKHPDTVKGIKSKGHVIGNHSWSHPDFRPLTAEEMKDEIRKTQNILEEISGKQTKLFRPPYGAVSLEILTTLREMDYTVINWSVDSWDWRDKDVDKILINTIPDVNEDAIVLFHSAGSGDMSTTVEALPEIIFSLKVQGYTFVTVDEILGVSPYK